MVSLAGQIIFLKVRRIFELLIFIIIIYIIYSRWSSKGNVVDQSHEKSSKKENNGRPDLAKYIHIDLKGAPPKVDQFYESFFEFLEKLQMGIKGVLIEYEDTLPLQGNLINVSLKKKDQILENKNFVCFFKDYSSCWLYKIRYKINSRICKTTSSRTYSTYSNIWSFRMDT